MWDKSHWPDWVRWIAQDADGCWWAYSVEPLQHDKGWYENEVGQIIKLGEAVANPQWQQSLQKIVPKHSFIHANHHHNHG